MTDLSQSDRTSTSVTASAPAATRWDRARVAMSALALFVVALAPRLYVATQWAAEAVWDGHYYDFGARRIAAGLGYSDDVMVGGVPVWHPWCHYPVGYSAFLGAFYKVFGATHGVAAWANSLVGAALATVTFLLARHALTDRRAALAGGLVALHPGLILYSALVMTEPLAALTTMVAFWLAVRDDRPLRGLALGALVLGVGALVRPQALLCAPALALVVPRTEPPIARLRAVAAACALTLLPVLPWTARNCRVMDGCALVSTNAGWNLAIGSFPRATGRFETLRATDGCRVVTGQVQQDRCWLAYGIEQIEADPRRYLALAPLKLAFTFDHESFPIGYLHEARPEAWPEDKQRAARGLLTAFHRLLVVVAAFGAVAFVRRTHRVQVGLFFVTAFVAYFAVAREPTHVWILACGAGLVPLLPWPGRPDVKPALALSAWLLVTTAATHAVFFGEDRYHMVASPVLCVLAAAALRRPSPRERARGARSARLAA